MNGLVLNFGSGLFIAVLLALTCDSGFRLSEVNLDEDNLFSRTRVIKLLALAC